MRGALAKSMSGVFEMEGARPRAPHGHGFNAKHAAKPSINRAPACGGWGRPPSMRGFGTRPFKPNPPKKIMSKIFA